MSSTDDFVLVDKIDGASEPTKFKSLAASAARDKLKISSAYKTADEQVLNSVTLQDDDHLKFTSIATGVYALTGHVVAELVSGVGIKCCMKASASLVLASGSYCWIDIQRADALTLLARGRLTAFDGSATVGAAGLATALYVIDIHGSIEVTTAGTLTLQWAQHTIALKDPSILYKYGRIHLQKMN